MEKIYFYKICNNKLKMIDISDLFNIDDNEDLLFQKGYYYKEACDKGIIDFKYPGVSYYIRELCFAKNDFINTKYLVCAGIKSDNLEYIQKIYDNRKHRQKEPDFEKDYVQIDNNRLVHKQFIDKDEFKF